MNNTFRIGVACFSGAVIGLVTAFAVSDQFWLFGVILGGLSGYFCYDFANVTVSASIAMQQTISKTKIRYCISASLMVVKLFFYILSSITVLFPIQFFLWAESNIDGLFVSQIIISISCFIISMILITDHDRTEEETQRQLHGWKRTAQHCNFFSVYFYYLWIYLYKVILFLISAIPTMTKALKKALTAVCFFSWHLFKLIHSNERLICMTDSAFGVVIGYWLATARYFDTQPPRIVFVIASGIIGAVLGMLQYEIISKRLLKLMTPKTVATKL